MLSSAIKIKNCWNVYQRRPFTNPEVFKSSGFLIYWMALAIFRISIWKKMVQASFQPLKLPDFERENGWRRLTWWIASIFEKSSEDALWIEYLVSNRYGLRVVKNYFHLSYANFAALPRSGVHEIVIGSLKSLSDFVARSCEIRPGFDAWKNRSYARKRLLVIPQFITRARRAIIANRSRVKRPLLAVLFLWATTALDTNIYVTLDLTSPPKDVKWRWIVPNLLIGIYKIFARKETIKAFKLPETAFDISAQWVGQFCLLLSKTFPVSVKRFPYTRHYVSFGDWEIRLTAGDKGTDCDFYMHGPHWGCNLLSEAHRCQVDLTDFQQFIRDDAEEEESRLIDHVLHLVSAIAAAVSEGHTKRSHATKVLVSLADEKGREDA